MLNLHDKDTYFKYLAEINGLGVTDMNSVAQYLTYRFPELNLEDARKVQLEFSMTKYQLLTEEDTEL